MPNKTSSTETQEPKRKYTRRAPAADPTKKGRAPKAASMLFTIDSVGNVAFRRGEFGMEMSREEAQRFVTFIGRAEKILEGAE